MQLVSLILSLILIVSTLVVAKKKPADSVLLSQVKTLTVRDGQKTSHRRVSALPQLACVGGNAKGLYDVDVMRCENSGYDYSPEDVQWTCKASLPPEFKLGSTEVVCEGYDSPDDPYILKGSCGVEYRLMLTDLGEGRYGKNSFDRIYKHSVFGEQSTTSRLFTLLFWLAFIVVICVFLYRLFPRNNGRRFREGIQGGFGAFGGGGGGGDDGHNDPPPPYTPKAPKPASSYRANRSSQSTNSQPRRQGTGQGWRPGFWSGTAAGAAAGYAAGRAGTNRSRAYQYDPPQPGPSNLFGRTRDTYGFGAQPASYGGGSSSMSGGGGSGSNSRQESTGFGSTRRR